jgi:2,3-bisphosphoglycerate-dependent phosphoglycerate mutase
MYKIVLIRHGESVWNKKGLFTGWTDVNLSQQGVAEARAAGRELKKYHLTFDLAFTSFLKRASRTLKLVLTELKETKIPVIADWRLNERHYGNLQGLNKQQMAEQFGEKQVLIWRRSYDIRPPQIEKSNKYNQQGEVRYKNILVPTSESLKDVVERIIPFWREQVVPEIKQGKQIIIAASGNSLRALIKYLDKVPKQDIVNLNIPTAIPLVYELDKNLKPITHYFLADPKKLQAAVDKVKKQGVKK